MKGRVIKNPLLVKKLRKEKVGILYLFGSEVEGIASSHSDIDLGVVFTETKFLKRAKDSLGIYIRLYDFISDVFPHREVDIVFLQRASLPLQFEAVTKGKILYEVSPYFRARYTERVIKEYVDFKPLLDKMDKATLEAFL